MKVITIIEQKLVSYTKNDNNITPFSVKSRTLKIYFIKSNKFIISMSNMLNCSKKIINNRCQYIKN